jgi:hypothetical protein
LTSDLDPGTHTNALSGVMLLRKGRLAILDRKLMLNETVYKHNLDAN